LAAVLQLERTIDVAKKERGDNVTANACTRKDLGASEKKTNDSLFVVKGQALLNCHDAVLECGVRPCAAKGSSDFLRERLIIPVNIASSDTLTLLSHNCKPL
jgi:hypothetical protein